MLKVKRIEKYGAFVELFPGKDALLHISQISQERINKVEDVLKIGDTIEVKITEIDKQGRVNASHKVLEQSKIKMYQYMNLMYVFCKTANKAKCFASSFIINMTIQWDKCILLVML